MLDFNSRFSGICCNTTKANIVYNFQSIVFVCMYVICIYIVYFLDGTNIDNARRGNIVLIKLGTACVSNLVKDITCEIKQNSGLRRFCNWNQKCVWSYNYKFVSVEKVEKSKQALRLLARSYLLSV